MTQEPCKKCGEYHNNCFELAELTDEEIWEEVSDYLKSRIEPKHLKQFAKAILRKASEK